MGCFAHTSAPYRLATSDTLRWCQWQVRTMPAHPPRSAASRSSASQSSTRGSINTSPWGVAIAHHATCCSQPSSSPPSSSVHSGWSASNCQSPSMISPVELCTIGPECHMGLQAAAAGPRRSIAHRRPEASVDQRSHCAPWWSHLGGADRIAGARGRRSLHPPGFVALSGHCGLMDASRSSSRGLPACRPGLRRPRASAGPLSQGNDDPLWPAHVGHAPNVLVLTDAADQAVAVRGQSVHCRMQVVDFE